MECGSGHASFQAREHGFGEDRLTSTRVLDVAQEGESLSTVAPSAARFAEKMEILSGESAEHRHASGVAAGLEAGARGVIVLQRFRQITSTSVNEPLKPASVTENLDVSGRFGELCQLVELSERFLVLGFQETGTDHLHACPLPVNAATRVEVTKSTSIHFA
jgi:hypothetical protein